MKTNKGFEPINRSKTMAFDITNKIKEALEAASIDPNQDNIKSVKEIMAKDSALTCQGAVEIFKLNTQEPNSSNFEERGNQGLNLIQEENLAIALDIADSRVDAVLALSNQLFPVRLTERIANNGSGLVQSMKKRVDAVEHLKVLDRINYDKWALKQQVNKQLNAAV